MMLVDSLLLNVVHGDYVPRFYAKDDEHLCISETDSFGLSHAEAGAWLIERWNLDSFMADSVRYHHEPAARLKSTHPLIRIVCLAHSISNRKAMRRFPGIGVICNIDDTTLQTILAGVDSQILTAATYFGIELTGIQNQHEWTTPKQIKPFRDQAEEKLADEVSNMALVSTAAQTFSNISDSKELLETIARTACVLFSFDSIAALLQKQGTQLMVGAPVGEHQQRMSEFVIPLGDGGILSDAVLKRKVTFVSRSDGLTGLLEEQLIRTLRCESIAYMPLVSGQTCLGVLIGGMSKLQADELIHRKRFIQSFANQAAASLEYSSSTRNEISKLITSINEDHQESSRRLAHEVNNPLSIIKNYLAVLDDKLSRNEPVNEVVTILNKEIDRVSRIVSVTTDEEFKNVDDTTEVNAIINEVVQLFLSSHYLPVGVEIVINSNKQPTLMRGSADPLRQILMNLIKNSAEAFRDGGMIEVRNNGYITKDNREFLQLTVSDTGTGIPPEVMANLFTPIRNSKNGKNRGLGLSIVHSLVTNLNGAIECTSNEKGTIFEILLPAAVSKVSSTLRTKQ